MSWRKVERLRSEAPARETHPRLAAAYPSVVTGNRWRHKQRGGIADLLATGYACPSLGDASHVRTLSSLTHADARPRHPRRHPRRRAGDATPRGDGVPAQADGRGRRSTDPLAHHEDLRPLRVSPVRRAGRVPWRHDQGRTSSPTPSATSTSPSIPGPGRCDRLDEPPERWEVTVVDTGLETMTGGRIKTPERATCLVDSW